jgi:uncharacterized protein
VTKRPLLIGVADLRCRLGERRRVERQVALDGLALSTAVVPDGVEIDVDLELESISNAVVVEGTVSVPWEGECRRCLRTVQGVVEAQVREIFETSPTEGETYRLDDDTIDLEPMIRDVVLLTMPLAPLCTDECRGPAPEAFPTGPGTEAGRPPDPRWAALDELRFDQGGDDPA